MYTRESIIDTVKTITADKLGLELNEIVPEARFYDDLGADSLDQVELVMEYEREFGTSIPDDKANDMLTVGDLHEYLFEVLKVSIDLTTTLYNSIGETFYSIVHGEVELINVYDKKIVIQTPKTKSTAASAVTLLYDGRLLEAGECILFPSSKNRDWNTYKSKVKFEIGEPIWAKYEASTLGWVAMPYSKDLEKIYQVVKFDQIKFKGYNIDIKVTKIAEIK